MKKTLALLMALIMTVSMLGAATAYADCGLNYPVYTLDGSNMTTAANGKPKLLIFFKTDCGNCRSTIALLKDATDLSGLDVVAIEINGASTAEIQSFSNSYGSPGITFGTSRYAMWDYLDYVGFNGNSISTPVVFYLDANNNIVDYTIGDDGYILSRIECLLDVSIMPERLRGDINQDGVVNLKDAVLTLQCITDGYAFIMDEYGYDFITDGDYRIDVNRDFSGTIKDAVLLLKYVTGENVKIY